MVSSKVPHKYDVGVGHTVIEGTAHSVCMVLNGHDVNWLGGVPNPGSPHATDTDACHITSNGLLQQDGDVTVSVEVRDSVGNMKEDEFVIRVNAALATTIAIVDATPARQMIWWQLK